MAFASPALALPGDEAIDSRSPFRLNTVHARAGLHHAGPSSTATSTSRRSWTATSARSSTSRSATIRRSRSTRCSWPALRRLQGLQHVRHRQRSTTTPTSIPNQTAVDLFGPDGDELHRQRRRDRLRLATIDADQNEPYVQEAGGQVAAINRPMIQPIVSCLGASAIEPLNTYKVGFGYKVRARLRRDPSGRGCSGSPIPSGRLQR